MVPFTDRNPIITSIYTSSIYNYTSYGLATVPVWSQRLQYGTGSLLERLRDLSREIWIL